MQWSFAAVGPVRADVDLPAGEIGIRPVADDTIEVSLEPSHDGSGRAMELIEQAEVSLDGDRFRVHVPSRPLRQPSIRCNVSLPPGSSLRVKTASADTSCTVELSSFEASTASGDIDLAEVTGNVEVTAASGDLRGTHIGGRLSVKGASTDIKVAQVHGDVDIKLASGDVDIEEADSSVRVVSASGDLRLGRVMSGTVNANSASGDFVIGVAKGVGAQLDINSLSGDVTCDLPFEDMDGGSSDVRIVCSTTSGDIRIVSAG